MKKLTINDINKRLESRNIKLVGDYLGARTKTSFSCCKNHVWMASPTNVLSGCGCPTCAGNKKTTKDEFNKKLSTRNIIMIGEYKNAHVKTLFKCESNHEWMTTPNSVIRGTGCPTCSGNKRKTKIEVNEVISNRNIEMIGEYFGANDKTLFRCQNNHVWESSPSNVIRETGCPSCASHGFNPSKSGYFYLLEFSNFVKYGITNNINTRLRQHKYNGKYNILLTKFFENGNDAKMLENVIKNKFGGKYVDKSHCPDGWTETLSKTDLSEIKLAVLETTHTRKTRTSKI